MGFLGGSGGLHCILRMFALHVGDVTLSISMVWMNRCLCRYPASTHMRVASSISPSKLVYRVLFVGAFYSSLRAILRFIARLNVLPLVCSEVLGVARRLAIRALS